VPLRELVREDWNRKNPDVVTYPELGSFVKFVYEKHGREVVREMWRHGVPGNLNELEEEWLAELAKAEPKSVNYKQLP
jgi:hypothetical protein